MKTPELDWDQVRRLLDLATLSPWMLQEIRTGNNGDDGLIKARAQQAAHAANKLSRLIDNHMDDIFFERL